MDFPPPRQKVVPPLYDDLHGATNVTSLHAVDPHKRRRAIGADQIDLRLSVAEYMDMSRLVVIGEDDEAQAARAMDGDHAN
jgi:hypothetical protein